MDDNLKKVWQTLSEDYELPDYDTFKEDMKDEENLRSLWTNAKKNYDLPDYDQFKADMGFGDEEEEGDDSVAHGTETDQAVESMNRNLGHMPQDVADTSGTPQFNGQSKAEKENPQMFQKPAVDPEPWKAEGLTKEQYEDIAWMRQANRPTPQGMINGEVWTPEEARAGEREQRPRTYQTKESWDDDISLKPSKYGQMRAGWRRGSRYSQLNRDGIYLGGYVAHTDADAAAQAEQMSDQQLIESYNRLSQQINKNYEGGIGGFAKTPEGQLLAGQLNAIGKELHFRDLGYQHTSSVPGRGDVDYRSWTSEPDIATEANRLSNVGNRDAEVARLYQQGLMSGNMADAERAMVASAALYCKENNVDMDTAYTKVETDAFNTAMRQPLEADVDKIYNEEKTKQRTKGSEAASENTFLGLGADPTRSAADAFVYDINSRRAAPTREMLNTMARRAINESAAARAYYGLMLREHMRGGAMDIIHARAAAMNDVRNLFRDIEVARATPNSSFGLIVAAGASENLPVQALRGLTNLISGDYESDMIFDEGMARAKASAGVMTNVLAGVAPFVADSALGVFKIPGLVGKAVSTGTTKLAAWSLNRMFGLGEEVAMKRLGGSWVYRTVTGALGGSANFGTYMGMSAAVSGFRQGNFSWGDTWQGVKHGAFDGLIFGGTNGTMSKIIESAKGGWAIAAETGALVTEAGVFTALDYMRTGEITAESVGQSLGMVLASRAMNFSGWASDVAARVDGTKWQHQVKGPVRWSSETRRRLQDRYPTLCRLMGGDNLAEMMVRGTTGKANHKTGNLKEVDAVQTANAIEREWEQMQNDPTVDFAAKRMANYVLNGQIVPTPAVCNWRVGEVDDNGVSYGETLDINGNVIERFKLTNDKERRDFEHGVAHDAERNRLGIEEAAWRSREVDPVIANAIDAVASAHDIDPNELAQAYFSKDSDIKGKAMLAAVREAESLVMEEMRTKTNHRVAVEDKYGIDLEEVIKTPARDRTENEQRALDEYELRLTDHYDESQDKSGAELMQEEKQQAHDDGMQAEGEQRAELKERLEDAANTLLEMRIDPRQFDRMSEEEAAEWLAQHGNDEEAIDAVMEYMTAKAAFEGIRDRVQEESGKRIEESNKQTDERTNSDTGGIHPVKMKEGGEEGRDAFVIKGKIVVNQDGTIDTARSDKDITVFYPDTGEKKVMTIADVKSGEPTIDPEQAKQDAAQQITEEVAGQAADDMNRTLKFNQDDTFNVLVDGKEVELKVVGVDPESGNPILEDRQGRRAPAIPEMVQQMHDEWREWKRNGGEPAVEDKEVRADKDAAPKVKETPAEEQGPAVMPAPGQSEPREMVDYLYRKSGMSEKSADNAVRNNLRVAAEKVEKAVKERDENTDPDIQKAINLDKAVEDAKNELAYWHGVQAERMRERAEQRPAKAEEPLQSNGTENQPAEGPRPAAETGGEEYDGLGMSPELRERMDDGTGVVGLVDEIAKQLGLQVREFDGPSYMPGYIEDGIIWINRNREEGTRDTYRFTLGHELTHGLKEEALRLGRPDLYESLKNAALRTVQLREGSGYDAFVRNLTNRYQKAHYMDGYNKAIAAGKSEAEAVKAGQEQAARVTREFIEEEIVCDTIGELMSGDVEGAQRMMQQVEDKTLVQKFKDCIVNLLTKIRDSFARGSKEYNELDDTIAKWNEMYNEVMKEREEMQRGLESTIEDDAGNAIGKRASVSSTFEGMGFKFFDEELGEDGKRQAMEDEEGNLYVTLNGRKFDKDNHVTIEDVADVECPMNWMLRSGLDAGKITPLQQYRIQGNYVKLLNLFLDMGAAKNGGVSNLEDNYQMLGETVFRCISPNGDKQYTVSADITRICKKNEAVINTISELQRRQGYGATPAQILDIYMTTHNEGYQVPCPVCYVFSRYIRNGKFASSAINGMEMYGQHLPGGSDPWSVDRWVQELKKLGGLKDEGDDGGEKNEGSKMFKDMSKAANDAITRNLNLIDEQATKLANEMNKPNPDKAKIRQSETDIRRLADEYKKATDVFNQMSQTNWIKTFAIRKTKAGWVMWEDAKLPEDMEEFKEHALDLRLTASTIENYPAIQRLRRSGGSASGKEITQASNNEIGEAVMGIGQKGATKYNNYYKEAMETDDPVERDRLLKEAQKKFDNAVEFAAKQNLRGGQRMWSWSDNIERLSPDIVSNLMQLEILGSGLQSYSKQLEGVEMVARMNGYVNGSLMGKDDGYREVDESMFDKNTMRLTKDIVDVIFDTRLKENRDQIVAGEGAMVHEVDGKYYVLIYDDVLGISAHGRKDADGNKVKMGLFDLNGQYNRAGNILVTMNDLHSKLALADDRVHFIIPWHSSGANSHVLAQMLNVLGQHIDTKSVDYTPMQEEKDMAKAKTAIPKHLHEVWDKARMHAEEKGWTCGIGKIDSNRDVLTKNQIRYRELRDAIMDGTIEVGSKEYKAIMADEFLRQTYEAVQEAGGKMTSDDKKYIYPYEYWIKTETDADGNVVPARIENADENGWRYMEYCRRLGRRPKFSGKYDGEKWSAAGDFTESKGYWKTLIDRRMYDLDGNFQDMTPIDSSGFDTDLVDRKATAEKYDVTTVADDEGVNRIVDIVQDTERTRIGEYLPNYGQGQNRAAKAMKPSVVTGKEKKEMVARYNEAAKEASKKAGKKKFSIAEMSAKDVEDGDAGVRFSIVRDPQEREMIERELERDREETGEYEVRYRAMAYIGNELHQPMASMEDGKLREGLREDDIERSDEIDIDSYITPETRRQMDVLEGGNEKGDVVIIPGKLRYHKGSARGKCSMQFHLVKPDGTDLWAAYNPYLHMSDTPLNDQFSSAWRRPELVVVRVLIPRSELSSGYTAKYAKNATGDADWKSGPVNGSLPKENQRKVTLSRYCKIDGIVPVDKAVGMYADKLLKNNVTVPFNTITPAERDELYRRGVKIGAPEAGSGKDCMRAYLQWVAENPDGPRGGVRFSLTEVEIPELSEETRVFNDGQFTKYYEGNIKKVQEVYADGDIGEMGKVVRGFDYWVKKQQRTIKRDLKYWDESNPYIRRDRMWLEIFQKVHEYATRLADDMKPSQEGYSSWGVKKNKVVTIDDIDRLFKAHNKDEYNDELWNRVLEVSRQLGVDDIKFKKTPDGVAGRVLGGRIRFDDERFNDSTVDDADKCETLLHEMLHHVTVYAINHTERLSEVQVKAVNLINSVFDSIKGDAAFKGEYGIKNVKEMVAELSNPQFREKLKQKNLWERIIDGILHLFGFDANKLQLSKGMVAGNTVETNAHDALRKHVETLLDNFNANAYTAFAEETRQYRPRFQLAEGETAAGVTLFSGGGLVEAGLRGVVDPRAAVEFDKKISGVYRDNHGNHIVTADVRDVDPMELAKKVDGPVEYFHASPVCKNFSVLKNGGEKSLDIETAQSTANAIDKMRPRIVTIENVANYQRSDALKVIADKLDELGYIHDIHIVDAADYGAATHRRRLILRAVAPGNELPAFPEGDKESFTPWFDRVSDLIADLPETNMPDWMAKRLANGGIYWKSIDRPLIVMSSGAAYGGIGHAFADEAAPTIAAGRTGDRIVMPDGKVYKVTGRVLARLMGLGDNYKLPQGESLAHTILGNGVPVELTKNVIGPLVKEVAEPSIPRFSLADTFYSNAAKAVEGVKQEKAKAEQWKAMLTKAGGIKAGEDKWMGLSTWLDEHKGETLTKDEVRQFVAENGIEMREVNYYDNSPASKEWASSFFMSRGDDGRWNIADVANEVDALRVYNKYHQGEEMSPDDVDWQRVIDFAEEQMNEPRSTDTNNINETRLGYTTPGLENKREIAFVVPGIEPYQEHDEIHFGPENQGRAVMWVRFGETTDTEGKRVLVIDEVQSNRHQDAREKGYKRDRKEFDAFVQQMGDKYFDGRKPGLMYNLLKRVGTQEEVDRYKELSTEANRAGIPAAPFEKNWHEVAMKRMLRLAAEEGFDKVAWTTGEQQAERYDLSKQVDSIGVEVEDGFRWVEVNYKDGDNITMNVEPDGTISLGPEDMEEEITNPLHGKHVEEVFGKEMAEKILDVEEEDNFSGDGLKIGGNGMRSFYDGILPQFMNKYGKRWGVKVGEVQLSTPGREVMHSVDVNEDMKRSVIQGQPLFSLSLGAPYQGSKGQIATSVVDRLPKGKRFVDLFSGGGAMTHAAMLSGKYEGYRMNDINPAGQDLFLGGMRGDYRDYIPREMTDEEFKAIKGTPEGLMLSYGGLGRNIDNDAPTRDRRIRRVQRLETLKPYADKVEASNTDYREVQLQPGDVVYADIPYEGTNKTGYREGAKFDKQAFSEWGLEQDVPIYVSEQSMPEGWAEVASWNMRAMRGKQRDEKLFVQEKFADQVRDEIAQYPDNTDGPLFQLTEDIENYQPRDVSWERAMLDRLMETAGRNEASKEQRKQAVRSVNQTLRGLFDRLSQQPLQSNDTDNLGFDISRSTQAAARAQRKYDRWTVDDLVSMAKSMLKSGLYKELHPYEVQRLINKINQGAGRREIQEQANTVFDVLMKANLRGWAEQLRKLMRTKPFNINSQTGVRTIGQVDGLGGRILTAMRRGVEMTSEELTQRIEEVSSRLDSDDTAANELEGLVLAQQYNDMIGKYDADNKNIKDQIREQQEKIYDFYEVPVLDEEGNPKYHQRTGEQLFETRKRLKPEFGGKDADGNRTAPTEENKALRKRVEATVANLENSMRENWVRMSEGYDRITDDLGGNVAAAVTRAKEFRENDKRRKQEIYHAANSDLLDIDSNTETIDPSQQASPANWSLVRGLLGPAATFNKMLRFFGRRSANGEGRLFNMFMRRQVDCGDNEWRSKKAGMDEMDAKAEELFGKKWMTMGNEMRDGDKFPPITLHYYDKTGQPRDIDLRQDEAVYIYCVNKMRDGQMKLQAMGIDDAMVEQITQRLGPRLVELADWYQGEFLPKQRNRYNEVYERMFGTPMAHIDNYIHLNINKRETASTQELGDRVGDQRGPTNVTGSIKERKTNVTPIELRTSIFDLAWNEHDKMEHWAAWGEFGRDLKDLINYRNFRAKVLNMKSVEFGNGKDLLDAFSRCAAIVTGDYDNPGRHAKIDRAATNLAKGVTSAKIGFRVFTALKQTLSFPAFFSDARPGDLIFAMSNAEGSVKWAMENLPGFSKRWQSRQAGDTRLMETDSDWKVWRNSAVKSIGRVSMLPNAAVDCLTVAIGARGVYLTAKRRYLSYGYTEEQAEKKALQDAAISYNEAQQSSEGAFTSAQQVDRTLAGVATTVFRNASMGYERRFTQGIRNLKNMAKSGYREEVIENTKKQMMEDGLSEEQAQRAAERVYNRIKWHSMLDVVNFGFVLPFFWNLGPAMVYILVGNDDEEKKSLIRDSALHALYGPIEGLSMGGTMSELANIITGSMLMDGKTFKETMKGLKYRNFNPLPIVSDMQSLFNSFSTDTWSGMNDLFNLVVQMGVGVNPETFTDMAMAFIDASNGDFGIAKESAMGFLRLINAPKSQVDKLYMDELGLTQEEAAKMSWEDLARRYAKYNAAKDAPLAAAFLPDDIEEAREERYIKKFYNRVAEKLEKASDEDLGRVYDQGDEQKKMVGKELAKRAGLEDGERFSKKSTSKVESTVKGHEAYQRERTYADMAEDILLQQAKAGAAADGDEEREKKIKGVLDDIAKKCHGDSKKGIKGMGVDKKTDDRILKEIRTTRSKALKELKISR